MPEKPKKPIKLPKTLGACADRLWLVKAERSKVKHSMDPLQAEEAALKEHIINTLPKSNASGISGKLCNVKVVTSPEPTVEDWEKLFAHIKKTGEWDLLGRSLNKEAVRARWEAKKKVPGVGVFNVVSVSITKV